jgi:choline kinase/thiamine kinase-like enzyme
MIKTVCILTAGVGSRMGNLGLNLNKALFPINQKAIITHIIKKFPEDTEFVIGLGYLSDQVKHYLELAHSSTKFHFVDIQNFDQTGSGPGYSLYCCKEFLQKPFYFVSCDTLWEGSFGIDEASNWVGVSHVKEDETKNYCNFKIAKNKVVEIKDKKKVSDCKSFTGLAYIKDYDIFFKSLNSDKSVNGEIQISNGLEALISSSNIVASDINWVDVGNEKQYLEAVEKYENYNFAKSDETLYIHNNKVIKFFVNADIVEKRFKKSKLSNFFPDLQRDQDNFYAYDFVEGETLYKFNNPKLFSAFLEEMKKSFWIKPQKDVKRFPEKCKQFYLQKTNDRKNQYFKKGFPDYKIINEKNYEKIDKILERIDWDNLYNGDPYFIHGDLQFDNIIFNKREGSFVLLDWRQDFVGEIEYGDIYYDFAKLLGGIRLNYDLIKSNQVIFSEKGLSINFDFARWSMMAEYEEILCNFIEASGYDLKKVYTLVGIIYLNMSPLHHHPFDKILFALSKIVLQKTL